MPAGLIDGLNRLKPAGGFYLPTLTESATAAAESASGSKCETVTPSRMSLSQEGHLISH